MALRPVLVPVQDAGREIALATLFGLVRPDNRIQEDAHDEHGNHYELKTTTTAKVSTARGVGRKHIEKWRSRFWLVSQGRNLDSGFMFDSIYFLSGCHMASWYQNLSERFDRDEVVVARVLACLDSLAADERQAAERMLRQGMLLNDPGIPWPYVQVHGIRIEQDYADTLRALVAHYPLGQALSVA